MKSKQKNKSKLSKGNLISICVVTVIAVFLVFYILNSFVPVNSETIVFSPPSNIFLKAVKSSQGDYYYQSTKGGKTVPSVQGMSPSIKVSKGNLVQIHLINEEKNELGLSSKHNLNIDEFNVHTKDLGYFQSESITFLADKTGSFEYYSSIHPNMKGIIVVD
ncbi:MAG: cupredoxin domain-containing protein [Nitrosopumilus sp.]|nr:cupredoxin domain-containing protein [Nitrosopumilus sp.]